MKLAIGLLLSLSLLDAGWGDRVCGVATSSMASRLGAEIVTSQEENVLKLSAIAAVVGSLRR
ncbi:hypothetical protein [Rubidibacter lacunae]|uniref:hypothetical protein n=1 Tax=Rubidibacter lacunae TaxID=582514 RepID=UPI0003FD5ACB|nr:hypothetical protein [Rubidibacter lacunae]